MIRNRTPDNPECKSGQRMNLGQAGPDFVPAVPAKRALRPGRNLRSPRYLMNSISEYFGSGQRSSATSFSSRSATSRTSSIAGITVSRM